MITISCARNYQSEREYICNVIFQEFLGLEYNIQYTEYADHKDRCWRIQEKNGGALFLPDILFQTPKEKWLTTESLPSQPLEIWNNNDTNIGSIIDCSLVDSRVPVIYGDLDFSELNHLTTDIEKLEAKTWEQKTRKEKTLSLPIDIFGSSFFMLTRYEEVVKSDRDVHDRFPAKSSLAYQELFIDRPIINEYLEILWFYLKRQWPHIQRKTRTFKILPTHDVDIPFDLLFRQPIRMAIKLIGDSVLRKSLSLAKNNAINWVKVKKRTSLDPFNTFNYIMDISEKHNIKSTFFFITDHSAGKIDGDYLIEHPAIKKIIQEIYKRGHKIGLHPSYNSYKDKVQIKKEFKKLLSICKLYKIKQANWGSRQHFLRWKTPTTAANLDEAGLSYDSTMAFADHPGFRSGVCYDYPLFDLVNRKTLNLLERPLIIMECSIIDKRYMNLGTGIEAFEMIKKLKNRCRLFNGNFTLLWHNSRLVAKKEKNLYEKTLIV